MWSNGLTLSDSTISNPIANPLITKEYIVYTTSDTCHGSDTMIVLVNQLPNVALQSDTSICLGEFINLGTSAIAGNSYSWSSSPIGFSSNVSLVTVNPNVSTEYYLEQIIDSTQCKSKDTVLVYVNLLPTISIGNDTVLCLGETVVIGEPLEIGFNYSWNSNPVGFDSIGSIYSVAPTITTIYYLVKQNTVTQCFSTDSIQIIVNSLPNAVLNEDTALCRGNLVYLGSDNQVGNTYSWYTASDFVSAVANPQVGPDSSTIYYLMQTDIATNCAIIDSVRLTVNSLPSTNINNDTAVCFGSQVVIGMDSVIGNVYDWNSIPSGYNYFTSLDTVSPASTTKYILTETNVLTGCFNSDSLTVKVNVLPIVNAGNDTTVCFGSSVSIGTPENIDYSYQWSSVPLGFISNAAQVNIVANQSTDYLLTATIDTTGCSSFDTIHVIVNPLPIVNAGNDTALCFGSTVLLGTDSVSGYTYQWTSIPVLINSNNAHVVVTPTMSADYILTKTNVLTQCSLSDTVSVVINDLPLAATINDTSICFGDSINIGALLTVGNTYTWTNSNSLWVSDSSNPKVAPTISTVYYLTEANLNTGCQRQDSIFVNVNSLPIVNAGVDTLICFGSSAFIGENFESDYSYSWYSSPLGFTSIDAQNMVQPQISTDYILVKANSLTTCINSDTVEVGVNTLPTLYLGNDTTICQGASLQLASIYNEQLLYSWYSLPIGLNSDSSSVTLAPAYAGTFYLKVEDSVTHCSNVDSILIGVNALPNVGLGNDTVVCEGTAMMMGQANVVNLTYTWTSVPASTYTNTSFVNVTIYDDISYVMQVVDDATKCANSDTLLVGANSLPVVDLGEDKNVCYGDTLYLGVTHDSNYSYSWNIGQDTSNINLSVLSNQELILTLVNITTGCYSSDSILINSIALPLATNVGDTALCFGSAINIGAISIPSHTYSWWSVPATMNLDVSNPLIDVTQDITYYILETDTLFACAAVDSLFIKSNPLPNVNAGTNQTICFGTEAIIGSTEQFGNSYSWFSIPAGYSSNQSSDTILGIDSTIYTLVQIIDSTHCTNTDTVLIAVNELPFAYAGKDTVLCSGNAMSIGGAALATNTYSWYSSPIGFDSPSYQNDIVPLGSTIYILTVRDTLTSCFSTDSLSVQVNTLPVVNLGNDTALCLGSNFNIGVAQLNAHSYSWSTAIVPLLDDTSMIFISVNNHQTYTLSVLDSTIGCSAVDSIFVQANTLPIVNAGLDTTVCRYAQYTLSANYQNGNTYAWSSSPVLSIDSINNPTVLVDTAYTLYLTQIIDSTGCSFKDTLYLGYNNLPEVSLSSDTAICEGASFSIGVANQLGYSYSWTSIPANVLPDSSVINVKPLDSTIYILSLIDSQTTCLNSDTISVHVISLPSKPNLTVTNNLCSGDTLFISLNTFYNEYHILGPDGFVANVNDTFIVQTSASHQGYYLGYVSQYGCKSLVDSEFVKIYISSKVSAGKDQYLCLGDSLKLNGSISGEVNTVLWHDFGTGSFVPNDTSRIVGYHYPQGTLSNDTLLFVLESTTNIYCPVVYDTVMVRFGSPAVINAGMDTVVCANTAEIVLNAYGTAASVYWNNGLGELNPSDTIYKPNYIPAYDEIEKGFVELVLHSKGACNVLSDTVKIKYATPPVASFNAITEPFNAGEEISFVNQSSPEVFYNWNFEGEAHSDLESPKHIFAMSADYTVTLIVTDSLGCRDTVNRIISVNPVALAVPTAFTPNGDGSNDVLYVRGGPFARLEFRVYNEWGNLLFSSNTQSEGWDGTYLGKDQPSGTYTYVVIAVNYSSEEVRVSGDVNILR